MGYNIGLVELSLAVVMLARSVLPPSSPSLVCCSFPSREQQHRPETGLQETRAVCQLQGSGVAGTAYILHIPLSLFAPSSLPNLSPSLLNPSSLMCVIYPSISIRSIYQLDTGITRLCCGSLFPHLRPGKNATSSRPCMLT